VHHDLLYYVELIRYLWLLILQQKTWYRCRIFLSFQQGKFPNINFIYLDETKHLTVLYAKKSFQYWKKNWESNNNYMYRLEAVQYNWEGTHLYLWWQQIYIMFDKNLRFWQIIVEYNFTFSIYLQQNIDWK
jgi:hypothetical protein